MAPLAITKRSLLKRTMASKIKEAVAITTDMEDPQIKISIMGINNISSNNNTPHKITRNHQLLTATKLRLGIPPPTTGKAEMLVALIGGSKAKNFLGMD
mmetsp:Transcript_29242/g.48656  ORF Transcript_29242/g.48656 Transcript_29242/m.48656 type:complete len:99 (+) Transcript_29242:322-618(+)